MSDDLDQELQLLLEEEGLLPPEQRERFHGGLALLNSYILERARNMPGTRDLLQTALREGGGTEEENALEVIGGLLVVAQALVALRQVESPSNPGPAATLAFLKQVFT